MDNLFLYFKKKLLNLINNDKFSIFIKKTFYYSIFIVIAIAVCVSILFYLLNRDFKESSNLSQFFSLVLIIITSLYVAATWKQLNIMDRQLIELNNNRLYQILPTIVIKNVSMQINRPDLFAEHKMNWNFYPIIECECTVLNQGKGIAHSIFILGEIIFRKNKKQISSIRSSSVPIQLLESRSESSNEPIKIKLKFFDRKGQLLKSIREPNYDCIPILKIAALYRNSMNACFFQHNEFFIYPINKEDDNEIIEWITSINRFQSNEYKNDIEELNLIKDSDLQQLRYKNLLEKITHNYLLQKINLGLPPIYYNTIYSTLEEKMYVSILEKNGSGFYIHPYQEKCPVSNKECSPDCMICNDS